LLFWNTHKSNPFSSCS